MNAHEPHLDLRESALRDQDVPESLDALFALHGSDPALDSRRHLRRAWWSRHANVIHALGAGVLTAAALCASPHHAIAVVQAMVIAGVGAAVILHSYAVRPGHQAGLELLFATLAAMLWWVPPLLMTRLNFDPDLAPAIWHVVSAAAAISCASMMVMDFMRSTGEHSRAGRICATLMGVFAAAAMSY